MKDTYDVIVWSLSDLTSPTSSSSGTVSRPVPPKKRWHSKTRTGCVRVCVLPISTSHFSMLTISSAKSGRSKYEAALIRNFKLLTSTRAMKRGQNAAGATKLGTRVVDTTFLSHVSSSCRLRRCLNRTWTSNRSTTSLMRVLWSCRPTSLHQDPSG